MIFQAVRWDEVSEDKGWDTGSINGQKFQVLWAGIVSHKATQSCLCSLKQSKMEIDE